MNDSFKKSNITNKEASELCPIDQGPKFGYLTDQNERIVCQKKNPVQLQSSPYKLHHLCHKQVVFRSLQEEDENQQLQMHMMSEEICQNDLNFNEFSNEIDTVTLKNQQIQSIIHDRHANFHESMSSTSHRMTELGHLKPQRVRSDAKPTFKKMPSIGEEDEVESPKVFAFSSAQKDSSKFMDITFLPKDQLNPLKSHSSKSMETPNQIFATRKLTENGQKRKGILLNSKKEVQSDLESIKINSTDHSSHDDEELSSLQISRKISSFKSDQGDDHQQEFLSSMRRSMQRVEENQKLMREEMDYLKYQINRLLMRETDSSRQGIENTEEEIHGLKKQLIELKTRYDQLEKKFNEKDTWSREEVTQVKTMYEEIRGKQEKQDQMNQALGFKRQFEVEQKYANFSRKPEDAYYLEFCRALYFQLSSLFVNSISLSFGIKGVMPTKGSIFPMILQVSKQLFSFIPYAGPFLTVGTEVVEAIYDKVEKGKEKCLATTIRHIIEKYSNCHDFKDVNFLAATIAYEITQEIGNKLGQLMANKELLESSLFRGLMQKNFHRKLGSDIEIAIAAFECLFEAFERNSVCLKAFTETEFTGYCVNVVINGVWYNKLLKK